jgi:Collagen triple helix repeat (20 copies)
MLMTALVALFGVTGTAFAAKHLITGADIKNGSITTADLSKATQKTLHGADGTNGTNGTNGDAGLPGAGGVQGGAGTNGSDGAAGPDGAAGTDGVQGVTGPSGPQGSTGIQGSIGAPGADGPTGPSGPAGPAGNSGATGGSGATGTTGATGPQGVPAVRYFANVTVGGTYVTQSGFIAGTHTAGTGTYVLPLAGAPNVLACVAMAQVIDGAGFAVAFPDQNGNVTVTTSTTGTTHVDHAFVVTVSC